MREMSQKELILLKDALRELQKFIQKMEMKKIPYYYVQFDYMFNNIEIYLQSGEQNSHLISKILQRDWENANHKLLGISNSKLMDASSYEKKEDACHFMRLITDIEAFFREETEESEEDETFFPAFQSNE